MVNFNLPSKGTLHISILQSNKNLTISFISLKLINLCVHMLQLLVEMELLTGYRKSDFVENWNESKCQLKLNIQEINGFIEQEISTFSHTIPPSGA